MGSPAQEGIKIVAVLLWFASFVALFFNPFIAGLMFVTAGILTAYRLMKGASEREARRAAPTKHHEELMRGISETPSAPVADGVDDRMRQLKALHDDGVIDDAEFEGKQQQLLDEL